MKNRKQKKQKNVRHGNSSTVAFADTEFYFDDCSICQAMRKADEEGKNLSMTELKHVFREARLKGAIVGGLLVEESDAQN